MSQLAGSSPQPFGEQTQTTLSLTTGAWTVTTWASQHEQVTGKADRFPAPFVPGEPGDQRYWAYQ